MCYYRKTREEKTAFRLLAVLHIQKNQSLEVIQFSSRATNLIVEAKPPPPNFSKVVCAPAVYVVMMRLAESGWNPGEFGVQAKGSYVCRPLLSI